MSMIKNSWTFNVKQDKRTMGHYRFGDTCDETIGRLKHGRRDVYHAMMRQYLDMDRQYIIEVSEQNSIYLSW